MLRRLLGKKPPRIVALGGGTGLATMLRGLKEHTDAITAIVTVGDNGGSSGRLRSQFGIIPPGDIRNCLVALADAGPTMEALFQYRFGDESEGGLRGHALGNLFITALTRITGDVKQALREATRILSVRGQVLPATTRKFALVATHADGTKTTGEAGIAESTDPIHRLELRPVPPPIDADIAAAIDEADLIVLGPGSLYSSVIPPCLVPGMAGAIAAARAPVVYVCNVMTQPGETSGYGVVRHVAALEAHTREGLIDAVVVNTGRIDGKLLRKYSADGQEPVAPGAPADWPFSAEVLTGDLVSQTDVVRHDPERLADLLVTWYRKRGDGAAAAS